MERLGLNCKANGLTYDDDGNYGLICGDVGSDGGICGDDRSNSRSSTDL